MIYDFKKQAAIIFFLNFLVNYSAHAQTYQIELKTFDACGIYEAICVSEKQECFSKLEFPFEKNGKHGRINAEIFIKDGFVDIDFHAAEQNFSTLAQGVKPFSGKLEDFLSRPQMIELYFPNPESNGDGRYSVPLVIRPPNAFMTGVLINIQPVAPLPQ